MIGNLMSFMLSNSGKEELAKLLLRVTVGVLMLFHGISKILHGVSPIEGMFINAGLPGFIAYGAYLGEVIAPLMLIAGFRVKIASLFVMMTMCGAIALAHSGDIFVVTKHGAWGIELQMFYLMSSLTILIQGAGKYSIDSYFEAQH